MPDYVRDASTPVMALCLLAFFALLTVVNVLMGFAAERWVPSKKIFAVPLAKGQLRHELVGNVVFVVVTALAVTGAISSDLIRFGTPTWGLAFATFFALLIGFQVFYYLLHRAMHHRSLLWMHRWHHRSQVTTPLSAQSMHVVESFGWMLGYVGLPLLLSLAFPISFWGWASYLIFNVSGNIVGHANVELGSNASRTGSLFANPFVYHAMHHARWTGHYGFQAALMDRIGRTEWSDWPALYARVSSGKPLESLKARGEESSDAV